MRADWIDLQGAALVVAAIAAFAVARTSPMRAYLAAVFGAGVLLAVFLDQVGGRLPKAIEIVAARAVGGGALYLAVAALIVHPWRRRLDGSSPAYIGASIVLAVITGLQLFSLTSPANAASPLSGQWRVAAESLPSYAGTVLIDRDGRATWDAAEDRGRPASFRGYVARFEPPVVQMTFTNGARVTRAHCLVQSSELLHCHNVYGDGRTSDIFTLTRVGPGPASLLAGN